MAEQIAITVDHLRKILRYDQETGVFYWRCNVSGKARAGSIAGTVADSHTGQKRIVIGVNKKTFLASRLAWFYVTGEWPVGVIDHINGEPLDNRWVNLRQCTIAENSRNKRAKRNGTSHRKGVCFDKHRNKWIAQIMRDGVLKFLGRYDNEELAAEAYAKAAVVLHGEFARF